MYNPGRILIGFDTNEGGSSLFMIKCKGGIFVTLLEV